MIVAKLPAPGEEKTQNTILFNNRVAIAFAGCLKLITMTPKQQTPINILLADDDKDDRDFFNMALKEVSIATHLTTVSDGERLMAYLSENSENLPDVLFLDLNMPRKNGNECLVAIKSNKKLKQLPVVIYSTSLQDAAADVLYKNGAHYYLHKCDIAILSKSIHRILTLLLESPKQPSRDKFILCLEKSEI